MKTDTKIFSYLDKVFWMMWGALPFIIGFRLYFVFTYAYFDVDGNLGQEIPLIEFTLAGKILACTFLGLGTVFYVLLLAFMHSLIRHFQHGNLFVERTLKSMTRIGTLLIMWPILMLTTFNATSYFLHRLGDLKEWSFHYGLDLPLIAAGLVILALRLVMSHAIKLHHEAQFTV